MLKRENTGTSYYFYCVFSAVCPIVALSNYLVLRGPAPGPVFQFVSGRPLSRERLSSTVQSILSAAGYAGSFSGHSFRIGAATTAASRGVPSQVCVANHNAQNTLSADLVYTSNVY